MSKIYWLSFLHECILKKQYKFKSTSSFFPDIPGKLWPRHRGIKQAGNARHGQVRSTFSNTMVQLR